MEAEVLKVVTSQGAWAALFVLLLFYILRENSRREMNYQNIIQSLADNLDIVNDIQDEVASIKESVEALQKTTKTN